MRLAALAAAMVVAISGLGGCRSPTADSHRCVVTPNDTVECSEAG